MTIVFTVLSMLFLAAGIFCLLQTLRILHEIRRILEEVKVTRVSDEGKYID